MNDNQMSSEHVGKIIAGGLDVAALEKMPHAPEWPESVEARRRNGGKFVETLPIELRDEFRPTTFDPKPEFQLPWGRVRIEFSPEEEDPDGISKESFDLVFRLDVIEVAAEQRPRAYEAFYDSICPRLEAAAPNGFDFVIHESCAEPGIAAIVFCPGIGSRAIDLAALATFVASIFTDGTVDSAMGEVIRQLEEPVDTV
jgi:hypothetical protein